MIIYLDESGDLGSGRGSKFFIIALLAPQARREVEHCVKRVRQRKIKKPPPELKAADATDKVREFLLKSIARLDIEIYVAGVDTRRIPIKAKWKPNDLYNQLAGMAVEECAKNHEIRRLVIHKRGDFIVRRVFDEYIQSFCKNVEIEHLEATRDKILQVANFVAWSIHRKYDYGDDRFYNLIVDKIRIETLVRP